jgi:hypothetical protein
MVVMQEPPSDQGPGTGIYPILLRMVRFLSEIAQGSTAGEKGGW